MNKGDTIRIKLPSGRELIGNILSVNHYERDGWYIELSNPKGVGNGSTYAYWKQGSDGGTIDLFIQTGANSHGRIGVWIPLDSEPAVVPWID